MEKPLWSGQFDPLSEGQPGFLAFRNGWPSFVNEKRGMRHRGSRKNLFNNRNLVAYRIELTSRCHDGNRANLSMPWCS